MASTCMRASSLRDRGVLAELTKRLNGGREPGGSSGKPRLEQWKPDAVERQGGRFRATRDRLGGVASGVCRKSD